MVDVPPVAARKAVAAGATAWLARLPGLVAELEEEWGIVVGSSYPDATEAFVAAAETADGNPAVLKVVIPREGDAALHEITSLRLSNGEGCVRLLRADEVRGAMLLERLGRPLSSLGLPIDVRHEILVGVAMRVWRPAPSSGLPTGAEKASWLVSFVISQWEDLGRPCSERAVDFAVAAAERRRARHDDERAVLVHGDVHQWNALEDPAGGFRLIDPDGLLAEPEYDLGILMREDPLELMTADPRERSRRLAASSGRDEAAIFEWGAIERVATGLLGTRIGLQPVASEMLAAAEHIARIG